MPWKTILTVLTFGAAMLGLRIFDPATVSEVWNIPVPRRAEIEVAKINATVNPANPEAAPAKSQLSDPTHELNHFYAALLKGSAVVVHYGDSPTTADLITADA